MFDQHPNVLAGLTGFISGLLLSVPVGPVNLTIVNEGARRGFRWAIMIALGAVTMDLIYCTVAFTGFATFFGNRVVKAAMELSSFVFLLYLGVKFLKAKSIPPTHKLEEQIEKKLHPHSAYMIGFTRVMGNPGVLLLWIVLAANFISRDLVDSDGPSKFFCISGVGIGASLWFVGLSYAVSRKHKIFTEKNLLRIEHFSGIALISFAVIHGIRIVWQMTHGKI